VSVAESSRSTARKVFAAWKQAALTQLSGAHGMWCWRTGAGHPSPSL